MNALQTLARPQTSFRLTGNKKIHQDVYAMPAQAAPSGAETNPQREQER